MLRIYFNAYVRWLEHFTPPSIIASCNAFEIVPRFLCRQSTGVVVFWRLAPRNTFGGTNKNDRIENVLSTSMPHKGAISCLTHTQPTTYAALGSPLVFSGATDCAIKVEAFNAFGWYRVPAICSLAHLRISLNVAGEL